MPQKLLSILFVLLVPALSAASGQGLTPVFSSGEGPDGIPFSRPMGIFLDSDTGRLYVSDTGRGRLVSLDPKGEPLKEFDAGGALKGPLDMVKAGAVLWVIDEGRGLVRIRLGARKVERLRPSWKGGEVLPDRIAWDGARLWVLDRASGGVLALSADGLRVEDAWIPEEEDFRGFADFKIRQGALWGLEAGTGRLFRRGGKAGKASVWALEGLVRPVSFDLASRGAVWVLDRGGRALLFYRLEEGPRPKRRLLSRGFRRGGLRYPRELILQAGRLYLLDEGNGRVEAYLLW